MSGSGESRRVIVRMVRFSSTRADDSVDSMRLGLRSVVRSMRAVFGVENVGGKLGRGPRLSMRGGVLAASELSVTGVALVAGSTISSINGAAFGTAGDFVGSCVDRPFASGALTADPATLETVRLGGNSGRAGTSLGLLGLPIGAGSLRRILID